MTHRFTSNCKTLLQIDGLNWIGLPRTRQRHPELDGLDRAEYQRRYILKQKLQRKAERIRNKART